MKNFIGNLLLSTVILLEFGESYGSHNPGPSSSSGRGRGAPLSGVGRIVPLYVVGRGGPPPMAERPPAKRRGQFHPGEIPQTLLLRRSDRKVHYMSKDVLLWLHQGEVVQANFQGMRLPDGGSFYQHNDYLVRIDELGGFPTVVYVRQNGTIMAVRAPKEKVGDIMEPSYTEWFIVYHATYFRLTVFPTQILPSPERPDIITKRVEFLPGRIELAKGGNKRSYDLSDIRERVEFPYNITFCIYTDRNTSKIIGAYLPLHAYNSVYLNC